MPKEYVKCVNALLKEGKNKDSAYAICTDAYKKRHAGRTPQEDEAKHMLYITVDSLAGVKQVEIKPLDEEKGVHVVLDGKRIVQYGFNLLNPADWTPETAVGYILKRINQRLQNEELESIKQAYLPCIFQSAVGEYAPEKLWEILPEDFKAGVRQIDPEPLKGLGALKVTYGEGSLKQVFEKPFFQKAGIKFEKTNLMINHSEIEEFGNAIPIGTFPKFLGAKDDGAYYAYYISPSEEKWRRKIKESVALGDYGYVGKISIEGRPRKGDFTQDEKGRFIFNDLDRPSGMALLRFEGMKGSKIIS